MLNSRIYNLKINYQNKKWPETDSKFLSARRIIIGDLHGNTLTLFIILIKLGILRLRPEAMHEKDNLFIFVTNLMIRSSKTEEEREYGEGGLTIEEYNFFLSVLKLCDVHFSPESPTLTLIGDTLADRMTNDVLMLALLSKIISAQYPIVIIYSNHDNESFLFYTTKQADSPRSTMDPSCSGSHARFVEFLSNPNLPQNIRDSIFLQVRQYANVIKMFDYDILLPLFALFHNPVFNIYSHAFYHFNDSHKCMEFLCEKFVPIPTTRVELERCIEEANASLKTMLNAVAEYWSFPGDQMDFPKFDLVQKFLNAFYFKTPCWNAIWRRIKPPQSPPFPHLTDIVLSGTHGHDMNFRPGDTTLDNYVGYSIEAMTMNIDHILRIGVVF